MRPLPHVGQASPGRKMAQVPVRDILDALEQGENVSVVARRLGISRAMIYRVKTGLR